MRSGSVRSCPRQLPPHLEMTLVYCSRDFSTLRSLYPRQYWSLTIEGGAADQTNTGGQRTVGLSAGSRGGSRSVTSAHRAACCAACLRRASCTLAVLDTGRMSGVVVCHIKHDTKPVNPSPGYVAIRARPKAPTELPQKTTV